MRMQLVATWCVTGVCFALILLGCGAPGRSKQEPAAAVEKPASESQSSPAKALAPLDLAKVTGYEVSVVAAHGKPIGTEKSRVDRIEQWSLNSRGQLIFVANKHTAGGGYVASDLYFVDAGATTILATQRHEGEHTGRRYSRLVGAWLNESGQVLLNGFREHNQEDCQLFFLEGDQISPCFAGKKQVEMAGSSLGRSGRGRIGSIPFDLPELHFGPQKQLCFLARNRGRDEPAGIYTGTLDKVQAILTAANDPSDALQQFSSFSSIYGTNSRGQILFDANVGQDHFEGHRLFLYTPADKPVDPKASVNVQAPPGTVREIARQGGQLPGTKITLGNNNGHNVWHMAALSERGDVVMIAETDRPHASGVEEDCLFVLRPDNPWKMVAAADSHLGNVKLPVTSVTHPTVNARGQVTFVARFTSPEDYQLHDERLFRLEPDGSLTDLAHIGQTLKSGEKVTHLGGQPLILAGGQVVVQPGLDIPSKPDHQTESVLIIDESGMFEALRLPAHLPEQPEFSNIQIEEIRVNDAGYLGVVYSNGTHTASLLLARPKYAAK